MTKDLLFTRRSIVTCLASSVALSKLSPAFALSPKTKILTRKIPKTQEELPLIGMGSWITFNVGKDLQARSQRTEVLRTFFKLGGGMIDSSPMYGSSEEVIGYSLQKLGPQPRLFSATKIWTPFAAYGKSQIKNSQNLWGIDKIDLLQVHNLVTWREHLETLFQMKTDKKLRYVGITTSHGLRHNKIEKIMNKYPIDFVQFTYNILDREAEKRLLPLASEKNIAVITNRPFQRGDLFNRFSSKPLPEWATKFDCYNWAQFFLKFIVSHPAVTCAIPATSQIAHMKENMGAAYGRLPSKKMRTRMVKYIESL